MVTRKQKMAGAIVRKARLVLKRSQVWLADQVGVSSHNIVEIERGGRRERRDGHDIISSEPRLLPMPKIRRMERVLGLDHLSLDALVERPTRRLRDRPRGRRLGGRGVVVTPTRRGLRAIHSKKFGGFEEMLEGDGNQRTLPPNRGECPETRPCPHVTCRHHLFLDVNHKGGIKLTFGGLMPWEIPDTCSLDIADGGPTTLEKIGEKMNITRERVRQLEEEALAKFRENFMAMFGDDEDS